MAGAGGRQAGRGGEGAGNSSHIISTLIGGRGEGGGGAGRGAWHSSHHIKVAIAISSALSRLALGEQCREEQDRAGRVVVCVRAYPCVSM